MHKNQPRLLPLLPLRDKVFFPTMVEPLRVGRDKSMRALEAAMEQGGEVLLVAQRRAKVNEPTGDDLFDVGTVGAIVQLVRLDGEVRVLLEGRRRARIGSIDLSGPFLRADVIDVVESEDTSAETQARVHSVHGAFEQYVRLNRQLDPALTVAIKAIEEPGRLADNVAARLELKLADRQALLEDDQPGRRLAKLAEVLQSEVSSLQEQSRVTTRVRKQIENAERGAQPAAPARDRDPDQDEFKNEMAELEERVKQKKMSKEAQAKVKKELKKLRMMSPMSAEATVVRNYIDWVLSLPWEEKTDTRIDVTEAHRILDEDHHGLERVKERILEYLAVQALVRKIRGPILCFVGPPGVGKTSLARSIARATGRRFVRLSLGGVRDEAEIRGHRRTYIGALPGKILQCLKKAGSANPVFLLDEVDKMSSDFRGDPAAALLEVLDPEQNAAFVDHYLDLDYDLSDVLFITTANNLHAIPAPLADRLEVITIAGYTDEEKLQIASRYLVPRQVEANGLSRGTVEFSQAALRSLVQYYTREAGVRNLDREIASVCRKLAKEHVKRGGDKEWAHDGGPQLNIRVTPRSIVRHLGPHKHRKGRREEQPQVGLVAGLAVTAHGGDLLRTEVTVLPGKGKLILTGQLGDVMQESAQAALSYVRSRAVGFGLDSDFHQRIDLHVHLPEGAIPKDGPSAGITIATGLVSALLKLPVRHDVAMTGEITLRGRVLPIGGLKEKVLAAARAGIKTVIIPDDNGRDVKDVPRSVLRTIEIVRVSHMDEVLATAIRVDAPARFRTVEEGAWSGPPTDAPASASPHSHSLTRSGPADTH